MELKSSTTKARFIELASEINTDMPKYVVQQGRRRAQRRQPRREGSRILVLGVTYKRDVDDTRESPALDIIRELDRRGGDVRFCDPYVESVIAGDRLHQRLPFSPATIAQADCVVLIVPHREFLDAPHWREADVLVDAGNNA